MADDDANFTVRVVNEATAPARAIKQSLKEVTDAFKSMDGVVANSGAKGGGFGKALSAAALSATEAALFGVGAAIGVAVVAEGFLATKFAEAATEAARFAQTSIQAITQLTGSGATANAQFAAVRHEAAALGLEVEGTVKGFQKLLAAQFEIGKAKELIRMGADLQVIGASGEEVGRVLMAITQIKSKGKLQAEEMLQLQEAGVSAELVYDALGKTMGKTRAELQKLQQKGKIGSTEGIEAILEAVRHKTGVSRAGDAALNNNTIDASMRRLQGDISNTFIDIGQAITPTLEHLTARIPELFKAIKDDPDVAELGDFLLNQFEGFGLWVDAHWPEIKATVLDAVHAIGEVIRTQFAVLQFVTDNWEGIRVAMYAVAGVMGIVAAAGFVLMAPLLFVTGAVAGLALGFVYAADAISDNWGKIKGSVVDAVAGMIEFLVSLPEQFMEMGMNMADGLIEGFESKIESIVESVTSLGERAIDALRNIWRSHSPAEAFADVSEDAGDGLELGFDRSTPVVEAASTRLGRASLQSVANQNGPAGGAGGGAGPIALHFHAEIQPGASEDDGRRFWEGLRPHVQREVRAMFEGEAA